MLCPVCDKEISSEDSKFMYPLEVPYLNVYLHRRCYLETDMDNYSKIRENLNKMLNIYDSYSRKRVTFNKK
jgi:hypothetical protein